jgi:hypothetical protein
MMLYNSGLTHLNYVMMTNLAKWRNRFAKVATPVWQSGEIDLAKWRLPFGKVGTPIWQNGDADLAKWRHPFGKVGTPIW